MTVRHNPEHLWQYVSPNGLQISASWAEHPDHQNTQVYYDTGSMALACTAGECDVVDIAK